MDKRSHKVTLVLTALMSSLAATLFVDSLLSKPYEARALAQTEEVVSNLPDTVPIEPVAARAPIRYQAVQVTAKSLAELKAKLGEEGMEVVSRVNRTDRRHIRKGDTLAVPEQTTDLMTVSPMPLDLPIARSFPKLIVVSRWAQALGVYESGKLVRWCPTSTGKRATRTPTGLFFTNWRAKQTRSTVNPEWVLPWTFNLDNFEGIALHQYDLPGYPASHGCVRLLQEDARWIYNWADQWLLDKGKGKLVAYGTPVLIFGDYPYGKQPPWKRLPDDPDAASVSVAQIEAAMRPYLPTIEARVRARGTLLAAALTIPLSAEEKRELF